MYKILIEKYGKIGERGKYLEKSENLENTEST